MTRPLAVPVDQLPISLVLHDGRRRRGVAFLPRGSGPGQLLESTERFLSVREGDLTRLYARSAVACVAIGPADAGKLRDPFDELRVAEVRVLVRLRCGVVLRGDLRHVAYAGGGRTSDCLNEAPRSFCLHVGRSVVHVAKAHVECVEEA